jgi:hypothetical protein
LGGPDGPRETATRQNAVDFTILSPFLPLKTRGRTPGGGKRRGDGGKWVYGARVL